MPHTAIKPLYKSLIGKATSKTARDLKGDDASAALLALIIASRGFLNTIEKVQLTSGVVAKNYFMFSDPTRNKQSRPVNSGLYLEDLPAERFQALLDCQTMGIAPEDLTKIAYTAAMSYACATDVLKVGDQKTPGTFFEVLIGHIVSRSFGVNPVKQLKVPTLDIDVTIPTDYVFDLGPGKNRVHLPIKMSTRERVVQVWAHQRVLDGMHGVGRFKGVLVVMAETNKQENISVVEVVLANQWMAYQMYIAQLFRVYYLDLPAPYAELKRLYPFIQVKPFGEFFAELDKIQFNSGDA